MKKKSIIISLLILSAVVILNLPLLTNCLAVCDENGTVLWAEKDNTGFTISFTHSANKGHIEESYMPLKGGNFTLYKGTFENYGAGMLDDVPEGVKMVDAGDHTELLFPEKSMEELPMIAGTIAKHTLITEKGSLKLYEKFPYQRIFIKYKSISPLNYMIIKAKA